MTPQKPACQPAMGLPALPTGIRCRTEWRSLVALPLAPPPQYCVGYMCAEVTWGTASLTVSPSGGEKAFSIAATHYTSETKHTATEHPHSQTYISGFTKAPLAKQAASPQSSVPSGTVPSCPSCFCCLPPHSSHCCHGPLSLSLFHVYLPTL